MQFKEIKRTRLYEEVLRQLQDYLASGDVLPGHKLPPERELAQMLNVSRVSVREALTVLEACGLVERRIGGGTFSTGGNFTATSLVAIVAKNQHLIKEPMEVRRVIEPQLARLAAQRALTEHLEELEENLRLQEECLDQGENIIELDSKFHNVIAAATGNAIFHQLVEALHQSLADTRFKSLRAKSGGRKSFQGHREIFQALKAHDPKRAEAAMVKHLVEVESLILYYLAEHEENL